VLRDLDPAVSLHKQTRPVTLKTEDVGEKASATRHLRLHVCLKDHALSLERSAREHHARVAGHLIDRGATRAGVCFLPVKVTRQ
jgi:hypothetical protein